MNADSAPSVEAARLAWHANDQPLATQFGDYYFSLANGLDESRYVFLHHNQLPQRWHERAIGQPFTIAETGFGSGLNFLATWQAWRQHATPGQRLHFISVERFPLAPDDLTRALALWPELAPFSSALLAQYPPPCSGFHRLSFDDGAVTLTLLFGDAATALAQLDARVDAWYLDGFAPAKNPQMWSDELFRVIASHSHAATTFATFTAASRVQKGLQAAGFTLHKAPGFGRKREMLKGHFRSDNSPPPHWFQRPAPDPTPTGSAEENDPILVIGAGIAGASTARALAERGLRVTLIDRGPGPASEGSGNPQGVLYVKLPARETPQSRIHLQGYQHSLNRLQSLGAGAAHCWSASGVLQLPPDAREVTRQQLVAGGGYPPALLRPVNQTEASELAGIALSSGGLWFPGGAWIAPAELCRRLLDHPLINCRFATPVADIRHRDGRWQLLDSTRQLIDSATRLVVACAASSRQFTPLATLPLKSIRGQISMAQAPPGPALRCVVCGSGYVSPPLHGRYCFGATFTLHDDRPAVLEEDHHHNLAHLRELSPALADAIGGAALAGRTGFRCTTPDYLPLAGPVADSAPFIAAYGDLRRDARQSIAAQPPLLPGLYVNLGHGSKGLVTAPLCGELIAALIAADPLPLARELIPYLHPARFIIKELKRRSI